MPKLNTNVFLKAVENVGTQDLDGIAIELTKDSLYYLPYRSVRNLIAKEGDKVAAEKEEEEEEPDDHEFRFVQIQRTDMVLLYWHHATSPLHRALN